MQNDSNSNEDIYEIMDLLRNGAIATGNDYVTNIYRQRCLGQEYFRLCNENLVSKLFEKNIIHNGGQWEKKWSSLLGIRETTGIQWHATSLLIIHHQLDDGCVSVNPIRGSIHLNNNPK